MQGCRRFSWDEAWKGHAKPDVPWGQAEALHTTVVNPYLLNKRVNVSLKGDPSPLRTANVLMHRN